MSDQGEISLVRPNPERIEIVSQFELPEDGKNEVYARPVICGGHLYLRHEESLYAYDIREKAPAQVRQIKIFSTGWASR